MFENGRFRYAEASFREELIPMSDSFPVDKTNEVRQLRELADYDKETVFDILDAGMVAHVAFIQDGNPVVVPMIYGRDSERIYLHGARKARVIRMLEQTDRACLNVTLVDGIVYARSVFNSSMNYRSVTVFGTPTLVEGHDAKLDAMRHISENTMPGRWAEVRDSHEREVKMTGVIELAIESASAKVSTGLPDDEDEDYEIPVWAGVLPVTTTVGEKLDDERLLPGVEASDVILSMQNRTL
jgi:nitroimidazol reductase NimA-like FMN-containing flavoprotein (pyridoxamine 5'-phosphate oxidase superfamily)